MSGHGGMPLGHHTPRDQITTAGAPDPLPAMLPPEALQHLASIDQSLRRIAQSLERIANTPTRSGGW